MENEGIQMDDMIFLSVLSACSHGGFVTKGLEIFRRIRKLKVEYYGCLFDQSMLKELNADGCGVYALMSDLYANNEMWEGVMKMMKLVLEKGMVKEKLDYRGVLYRGSVVVGYAVGVLFYGKKASEFEIDTKDIEKVLIDHRGRIGSQFEEEWVQPGPPSCGIGSVMSSSAHPVIVPSDYDVEDTFSCTHSPDYTLASPDYFPASPRNTSPDPSDDLSKYLLASLAILPFYNDPYMKVMQAYNATSNESSIPPPDY
ncbi:reverse transcriptase domain-containing protein [Tanacetum coccineum]